LRRNFLYKFQENKKVKILKMHGIRLKRSDTFHS
jgi:hypothetical protein